MPTAEAVKLKIEKKKPVITPEQDEIPKTSSSSAIAMPINRNKSIKLNPIVPPPTPVENTIKKLRQTLKSSFKTAKETKTDTSSSNTYNTSNTASLPFPSTKPTKLPETKKAQIIELEDPIKEQTEQPPPTSEPVFEKVSFVETVDDDLITYSRIEILQIRIEQPLLKIDKKKKKLIFIILTILALSLLFLVILTFLYYIYVNSFLLIFGL